MLIPVAAALEEVQEEEEGNIAAVHLQHPEAEGGIAVAAAGLPLQEEAESMAAAKVQIDFPPSFVPLEQSLASHPLEAEHLPAHKLEEHQTRYEVGVHRAEEEETAAVRPQEAAGQSHAARPKADSRGLFRGSTLDLSVFEGSCCWRWRREVMIVV